VTSAPRRAPFRVWPGLASWHIKCKGDQMFLRYAMPDRRGQLVIATLTMNKGLLELGEEGAVRQRIAREVRTARRQERERVQAQMERGE